MTTEVFKKKRVNIRVCIRSRNKLKEEVKSEETLRLVSQTEIDFINIRSKNQTQRFNFDGCYGPETSQKNMFDKEIKNLLPSTFIGQNVSVLAYGHTGAGKTFTMQGTKSNPGIIPRTVRRIFQMVDGDINKGSSKTNIYISALEVYNEEIFDLLKLKEKSLSVRQDGEGFLHVLGLHEVFQYINPFVHMSLRSISFFSSIDS